MSGVVSSCTGCVTSRWKEHAPSVALAMIVLLTMVNSESFREGEREKVGMR